MNKSYQYLDIDINKKIYRKLNAVQGDTKSRYILVSLYNNSMAFDLSNCSVKVFGVKSDKKIFFNYANIIDTSKGQFEIELTSQALAVNGELQIQILVLGANQERLTTCTFFIDVDRTIVDDNAIQSENEFTALTKGLADLAEYDIYKNNILKHDKNLIEHENKLVEHEDRLSEVGSQLAHITREIEEPITFNRCDEEMLLAIQNKEGETSFNLLSIPRDNSVNVDKLNRSVRESLFNSIIYDDSKVERKGTVGSSDLYLINNQFTDCIINSVTLSCLSNGIGQVRIYENINNIVTLVESIEFDTNILGTTTPKIDLNYKCGNTYIGFTREGEGSIDFGNRNVFGLLNCTGKKGADSFDLSESTSFDNLSMKVTIDTSEYNFKKNTKNPRAYVIVDKNGNGDYTSIQEAINNYNEIPIFIRNGVYEEGRLECADKNVTMIGEDKYQVKIVNYGGFYGEDCIYASKGTFSNISFISEIKEGITPDIGQQNGAYAVHVDSNNQAEGSCVFNDCIIISDFSASVGAGLRKNNTVEFNNCDIISRQYNRGQNSTTGGMGALFVHNNHTGTGDNCPNQLIRLNNCRLKAELKNVIKIQEIEKTNANATFEINNCLVYSETNGINDVIEFNNGINNFDDLKIWKLSKTSYGNTVKELNKF